MGMAASQARYLGLTARKINVEYQGQQVNQQRTALANQSAGLFQELLALEVPTPPSQNSYYTEEYQFNDPSSSDGKTTLSSIVENEGSNPPTYTVTIKSKIQVPEYTHIDELPVSIVKDEDGKYKIMFENGTQYSLKGPVTDLSQTYVDEFNKIGDGSYTNEKNDNYYYYENPQTGAKYYINASKTGFDPANTSSQDVDFFSIATVEEEVTKTINNATLGKTEGGLFNSITWVDESGKTQTRKLTQASVYDEEGYDNAMQEYTANKVLYEKKLADINAKTEKLQQEDRTLELRLKQLDTEQEALQTEMESVKKVIDKSVESVFKTFQ